MEKPVPVQVSDRLFVLDVLRGFALLGIIVVNIQHFSGPLSAWDHSGTYPFTGQHDVTTRAALTLFVETKFISIFSMLFGVGLALQLRRPGSVSVVRRRMLVLLVFGLLHGVLIWMGDVLTAYALCGLLLLAFARASAQVLLAVALVTWGSLLVFLGTSFLHDVRSASLAAVVARGESMEGTSSHASLAERSLLAYGSRSFVKVTRQRADEFFLSLYSSKVLTPMLLALMLFGMWIAKAEGFERFLTTRHLLRRALLVSGAIGVTGHTILFLARLMGANEMYAVAPAFASLELFGYVLGGPALGVAYCCGVALLVRHDAWLGVLGRFAAVGRMSISNYLLQSVVATFVFYGHGLGLYGMLGPLPNVVIAVSIFTLQLLYSPSWLQRFRYGPVEWLWRSLAYGARQPMRREVGTSAAMPSASP
jgi:uncharacterized protein